MRPAFRFKARSLFGINGLQLAGPVNYSASAVIRLCNRGIRAAHRPVLTPRRDYTQSKHLSQYATYSNRGPGSSVSRAYIALGSNLGDRLATIEQACSALAQHPNIELQRTSSLYETAPWGPVAEQSTFLNGVCEIDTTLEPIALLDCLQQIEHQHDRTREIRWGPRTLDLDLLMYDHQVIDMPRLTVPHPRIAEREFVLRPWCDLVPNLIMPNSTQSVEEHLECLPEFDKTMISTFELTPGNKIDASRADRPVQIMSILNVTPDSFSDGGLHHNLSSEHLEATIKSHVEQGATIIDIGGQSSRPGARVVSEQIETERVVPAVQAAKRVIAETGRRDIAISIDTYRSSVAREALRAGAHMINDISAGRLDSEMLSAVAEFNRPIVLMHMRGDPTNMSEPPHTLYPDGLIETVATELLERVEAAQKAGVRRWQIMLDPGIGFAKTQTQNLEILQRLGELRAWPGLRNLPWLVGSSRKSFIGRISGVEAADRRRDWGTAATVAAAVQGGADVVRVHAVREMKMVTRISEAIWRRV